MAAQRNAWSSGEEQAEVERMLAVTHRRPLSAFLRQSTAPGHKRNNAQQGQVGASHF